MVDHEVQILDASKLGGAFQQDASEKKAICTLIFPYFNQKTLEFCFLYFFVNIRSQLKFPSQKKWLFWKNILEIWLGGAT